MKADTRQNLEFNAALLAVLRRYKPGVAIELLRECQEDCKMGWLGRGQGSGGEASLRMDAELRRREASLSYPAD